MTYEEVEYAPGLGLDLYDVPDSTCTFIYIHGGSWTSRDKSEYTHLGNTFQSRGFRCAIINYTLSPNRISDIIHPIHVQDTVKAIEYLSNHYTHLIGIGHSAGAHILATLHLQWDRFSSAAPALKGAVGVEGIYDIIQCNLDFPSYADWFFTFAFGPDQEAWRLASPQYMDTVGFTMPWLVIHTPEDELVKPNQSTRFHQHLLDLHVPADLLYLHGKHFDIVQKDPNYLSLIDACITFASQS